MRWFRFVGEFVISDFGSGHVSLKGEKNSEAGQSGLLERNKEIKFRNSPEIMSVLQRLPTRNLSKGNLSLCGIELNLVALAGCIVKDGKRLKQNESFRSNRTLLVIKGLKH